MVNRPVMFVKTQKPNVMVCKKMNFHDPTVSAAQSAAFWLKVSCFSKSSMASHTGGCSYLYGSGNSSLSEGIKNKCQKNFL